MSLSAAFSTAFDVVTPPPAPLPWPQEELLGLAACLCEQVPDVCFCGLLPGLVPVLDYCTGCDGGACGQAWVRLVRVASSATEGTTFNPCTGPLEATVEVGVARCAPMPGEDGDPPTLADQLESALQTTADMRAALRAIRCCEAYGRREFEITEWVPFGPEGGCVGGLWAITLFEGS